MWLSQYLSQLVFIRVCGKGQLNKKLITMASNGLRLVLTKIFKCAMSQSVYNMAKPIHAWCIKQQHKCAHGILPGTLWGRRDNCCFVVVSHIGIKSCTCEAEGFDWTSPGQTCDQKWLHYPHACALMLAYAHWIDCIHAWTHILYTCMHACMHAIKVVKHELLGRRGKNCWSQERIQLS